MIGLSSDYTELVKEYTPMGQKVGLWEQFLTGTSQQYQTLTQQTQDVYAYDISSAYANYKQQQLQLQMNQQLGEGFKQQLGTQLQSEYGSAYRDIKTQEATVLGKIGEQYTADILAGQKEFAALGEQARTFEKLISEYATSINKTLPENAYKTTKDEQTGVITKELTDYGRLWYNEILDDSRFQDWILSEESASALDLEDREAFYEAYRQNPELYRSVVAGLSPEFNPTETEERLEREETTQLVEDVKSKISNKSPLNITSLSKNQLSSLKANIERNPTLVSKHTHSSYNYNNKKGESLTDDYGHTWYIKKQKEFDVRDMSEKELKQFSRGDIVSINNKYYIVDTVHPSAGRLLLKEVEK